MAVVVCENDVEKFVWKWYRTLRPFAIHMHGHGWTLASITPCLRIFVVFFFLLLKDVYAAKAINSETNIGVDRQRNAHLAHPISDIDIHN